MINFGSLVLDVTQVIDYLKRENQIKELCKQEIGCHIVRTAAKAKGLTISDHEIQAEADQFRHQMKLESAKDTLRWLQEQMITPKDWEAGIYQRLLSQKLAKHLFGHEASKHFAQNKLSYENL